MNKFQFYALFLMVLTFLIYTGAYVQIQATIVKDYYIELYDFKKLNLINQLDHNEMKALLLSTSTLSFF